MIFLYVLFLITFVQSATQAMQQSTPPQKDAPKVVNKARSETPREKLLQAMIPQLSLQAMFEGKQPEALLFQALALSESNEKKAYQIYAFLSEQKSNEPWHAHALTMKGMALEKGLGVKQDVKAALGCYTECFKIHKDPKALLAIADHYEKSDLPKKYDLAAGFYKKAFSMKEPMAGFQIARLIYNEKIKPETNSEVDETLNYLRPAIQHKIPDALYLFATLLLDNNRDEEFAREGLRALLQAAKNGDAFSALQLGILFKNGLHVEQNKILAQQIFNKAMETEDTPLNLTAKAYMYMNGVGVEKNKPLAHQILETVRPYLSEVGHIIDNLFSEEDKLGAHETTPQEMPQATPPPAPIAVPVLPAPVAKALPAPALENPKPKIPLPRQINHKTLLDKCNALSVPQDGSMLEIDMKNHVISIIDPKYGNQFIIPFEEEEFNWNLAPKPFKYDPRVEIWHTKSLKELKANNDTRWRIPTHRFGKAADYAIQLVGIKNPYLLKGKKGEERLVHQAESLSQKKKGHFEFTFYGSRKVLYHRNFKPYAQSEKK